MKNRHVHVHGRHKGIARMKQPATRPSPRSPARRKFGTLGRSAEGGSFDPITCEKPTSATLEQVAVFDDRVRPAAPKRGAGRFFPGVAEEGLAVQTFEGADDALLQPSAGTSATDWASTNSRRHLIVAFRCRPMKPSTVSYQATIARLSGSVVLVREDQQFSGSHAVYCRASKG